MSDMGLEASEADAAEQQRDAVPEPDEDRDATAPEHTGEHGAREHGARQHGAREELPLEANEADAAEQDQELDVDDDEYR